MAYPSAIEDQEPWRMVAEDASHEIPPASLPWSPGNLVLGAEEEKESNVTLRMKRENLA